MPNFPETRQSLLVRVRDRECDAWTEFSAIYRPAIYRIIRRRGWQDADAQDISQLVLVKVSKAIEDFDPQGQARFRTWLTTICRRTLVDELRRRETRQRVEGIVDSEREAVYVDVTAAELMSEHRRQVFRWAAKRAADEFSTTTWTAFWETAVGGQNPQAVATQVGISVGAVYTARSRVMQRLKQLVLEFEDGPL